jgi:antitoxin component HigA of HigAB toxin-antitoxin module
MSAIAGISSYNPFASKTKPGNSPGGADFASLLAKANEATSGSSTAPTETVDPASAIEQLLEQYQEQLSELQQQVESLLHSNNIDTSGTPVNLSLNLLNELKASGEHPELDKIQSLLDNSPQLQQLFQQVASIAEQVAAGQGAVVQHGELKLPARFNLKLDGGFTTPSVG